MLLKKKENVNFGIISIWDDLDLNKLGVSCIGKFSSGLLGSVG